MSEAGLQTQGGMEGQPVMPVRRLNNYVYCPRLFYFQWVENIFQESADTVAGSHVHRNVDAPSRLEEDKAKALSDNLPEGAKLRSLRLESEALGIVGVMDLVEGGPDGAQIVDYKKGSARRTSEGEREAREPESIQVGAYALLLQEHGNPVSFRNIWVREINKEELLAGSNFKGWYTYLDTLGTRNDPDKNFSFRDGLLHIEGKRFGYLSTEKSFDHFYLRVVFKWGEKQYPPREKGKRDSGILYYFENGEKDTLWPKSIECQVQEGDCGDTWCVGTMVESSNKSDTEWGMKRIFRSENFENPTGEWNTMEILCNGSQTEHYVNGHLVNTGAKTSVAKGKILLQSEGAEVYYKSVELFPY